MSSKSAGTPLAPKVGGLLPPHLPVAEGERSIVEGSVTAVAPGLDAAFYNQVQVLNRDVSTAALRAWDRRRRREATRKQVTRAVKAAFVKQAEGAKGGPSRIWTAGGTMAGGMGDTATGASGEADQKEYQPTNEEVARAADAAIAAGYRARKAAEQQRKDNLHSDKASQGSSVPPEEPCGPVPGDGLPGMRIFEALAATGLRSARYCREVPRVAECIANDLQPTAVAAARRNLSLNGACPHRARAQRADAIAAMFEARGPQDRFDVVDLDPYGSPAPFLDSALQSISDGGLLCVTATDMIVLAGSMTSAAWAKYGRQPVKGGQVHSEQAIRLVLATLQEVAARHRLSIQPLLCLQPDFYLRCFVRVWRRPHGALVGQGLQGLLLQCGDCPSWWLQPMGRPIARGRGAGGNGRGRGRGKSKAKREAAEHAGAAADSASAIASAAGGDSASSSESSQPKAVPGAGSAFPRSRPAPTSVTMQGPPGWARDGSGRLHEVDGMPAKVLPARAGAVEAGVGRTGKRARPDPDQAPALEPGIGALGPGGVCGVCEGPVNVGGPLWMGPLHDPQFVAEVRAELEGLAGPGQVASKGKGERAAGAGGPDVDTSGAGGFAVPESLFWLAPEVAGEAAWRCPVETAVAAARGRTDAAAASSSSSELAPPADSSSAAGGDPYAQALAVRPLPLPLGEGASAVEGRRSGELPDAGSNDAATVRASRQRLLGLLGAAGSELLDAPLYVSPAHWSSALKVLRGLPRTELEAALARLGYRTSPAHGSASAVKTDAPAGAVAAVARAWALMHGNPRVTEELRTAGGEGAASELSLAARITRGLDGAQGRRADALRDAVVFGALDSDGKGEEVGSGAAASSSQARKGRQAQGVKFMSNPQPRWGPKQRARGVGEQAEEEKKEAQAATGGGGEKAEGGGPQLAMDGGEEAGGGGGSEPQPKRPRVG